MSAVHAYIADLPRERRVGYHPNTNGPIEYDAVVAACGEWS